MTEVDQVITRLAHDASERLEGIFAERSGRFAVHPRIAHLSSLSQIMPAVVRALRGADALCLVARTLGGWSSTAASLMLEESMIAAAAHGISRDAQGGYLSGDLASMHEAFARAHRIHEAAQDGVYSRALVHHLYDNSDPHAGIWSPLEAVLLSLRQQGLSRVVLPALPALADIGDACRAERVMASMAGLIPAAATYQDFPSDELPTE
ncbi:hypothetical protein [Geopseudomonas aromaticivorans]